MEPVLKSFLYCDSIVPAPDGKLNLYGLFTDLYAKQFPITYPKFSVLSTWGDGLGFHVQRIKVVNPANTMVLHQSPELYFTLESEDQTVHVQTDVNQMVFTEPGAYTFQVILGGRLAYEHHLHLKLLHEMAPPPQPACKRSKRLKPAFGGRVGSELSLPR